MKTITISPKFQIVIPKIIRESMKLNSGTRLEIIHYDNRIELIPVGKMKDARGLVQGLNTSIKREKDRL